MKTACLTVFYPGMETFAKRYIQSINLQTVQNFTLFIANDGFSENLNDLVTELNVPYLIFPVNASPQKNRLMAIEACTKLGFELIVCSDADETMYNDRIEKVQNHFTAAPQEEILYINSVAQDGNGYFDLNYKPEIRLNDIIHFNVLGYGALNFKTTLTPFILNSANENALVFDWWFAARYLLHHKQVRFNKNIKNNYHFHTDSFVGPNLEVSKEKISFSLKIKRNFYQEMLKYCQKEKLQDAAQRFEYELQGLKKIADYISKNGMEKYEKRVITYLKTKDKLFWWQEVVSLSTLNAFEKGLPHEKD